MKTKLVLLAVLVSSLAFGQSSVTGTVFYDYNDTSCYLDPSSTGISLRMLGSTYIPNGESYWIGATSDSGNRLRLHHDGDEAYIDYYPNLYFRASTSTKFTMLANGNIGIGSTSPEAKLSINTLEYDGNASSSYPTASSRGDIVQFIETNNNGIEIGNGKGCNDRKAWILARHSDLNYIQYGTFYSTLHLQPNVGNKTNYMGVAIGYSADTSLTVGTHLAVNGKVGIGTIAPDQMLTVNGKIHAQEVIIDLDVPVADYVFSKDYNLMPLPEVEKYVQKNSHLPEIPSAAEVKEKGLSMGEMQNQLLKKVEELTLYVIDLKKENAKQNKRIQQLQKQLKSKK